MLTLELLSYVVLVMFISNCADSAPWLKQVSKTFDGYRPLCEIKIHIKMKNSPNCYLYK